MLNSYKLQIIILIGGIFAFAHVASARMESTTYQINADVISAGGSLGTSTNYTLNDTISENVIGTGASTNYILKDGFWQMVNTYVQFNVDSALVDFGALTPGTPVTGQSALSVTTDAWNGYTISIEKDDAMRHTNAVDTIADHNGNIAAPLAWSGANATGLGVTVASGTNIDAKWGNGTMFAAIPTNTPTVLHQKSGYRSPADVTVVGYRIDVPSTQRSGTYTTNLTFTVMPSL